MSTIANIRKLLPGQLTLTVAVGILAAAFLAGKSWLESHDEGVRLAATVETQSRVQSDAENRQRLRDALLAKTITNINVAKRRVNTPSKAAAELPEILPPLPKPVTIELPAPTVELPAPAATATIPQEDLKPIYDYVQDCSICQVSLTTARDDLADERDKLAAVTKQRDAAIRSIKGGSFWSRLRRNLKWFALGAAAATLAMQTHNNFTKPEN
jgi:hypothetical protein